MEIRESRETLEHKELKDPRLNLILCFIPPSFKNFFPSPSYRVEQVSMELTVSKVIQETLERQETRSVQSHM